MDRISTHAEAMTHALRCQLQPGLPAAAAGAADAAARNARTIMIIMMMQDGSGQMRQNARIHTVHAGSNANKDR